MKHTCKRRGTRGRSPGRKEKERRALKALAAAGAIAGGTQAYALPVRFDNPAHGEAGHFHWAGAIGERVWLDFALPADEQPAPEIGQTAIEQRVYGTYSLVNGAGPDLQTGVGYPGYYQVVGVAGDQLIPTDGTSWNGSAPMVYSASWGGSLLPEGEATYLGVRFDLGSGYQYAWIGVVRSGVELEAFAWGREREPGVPIPAGALSQGACFGPEGCQEYTEAECEALGRKYIGDGITCESVDIPTVSEWGLAIMALALLAAGTWVVKKRVPQPSEA